MGGPRGKKKDAKTEQYKEVCPPQKLKDLDALIKSLKGNEDQIMEKIQEWWEEPATVEPEWETTTKKNAKKKQEQIQGRGGAGGEASGGGGGRGGGGRSSRGRGGGERGRSNRGAGRGDRRTAPAPPQAKSPQPEDGTNKSSSDGVASSSLPGAPTPVDVVSQPKGAWGQRTSNAAPTESPAKPAKPEAHAPPLPPPREDPIGVIAAPEDPSLSGMVEKTPATPTGNVWATKGSAHLIQAEKPKPPPPPQIQMPQSVKQPKSPAKQSLERDIGLSSAVTALETGLSPSLSGVKTSSWTTSVPSLEMSHSASSVAEAALGSIAPEVLEAAAPVPPMSPAKPPAPTNVLNMGHWESGEGDDAQNLDFGFGSFGPESEQANEPPPAPKDSTVSPARPPPGLSIGGGMPPMPANAVLVHELENKLENTSLGNPEETPTPMPPPAPEATPSMLPQNYHGQGAYGMGMYNYNTPGASGFMGGPVALGVNPQQQKGPADFFGPQQSTGPQHLPPGGLYGSAAPTAGTATPPASSTDATASAPTSGGMPPGMPNAMPYNPALFYGQQPYQMGQPHGGVGYGYGYGAPFGGAAGHGFYGQQVMGQSGGYPSAYDDQPPQGRNDYPSKSSNRGYRSNGNQYQSQFNPQQHGGYGGQPYNMGYNVDHFNQRGGYGPSDPYGGMQPQQQGSSSYGGAFQDDDNQKGGKRGGRNNGGFQQQQHQQLGGGGHQQQQQQPPFLGGGGGAGETSTSSNQGGGWSNNSNSNHQGGWAGTSWQGGN